MSLDFGIRIFSSSQKARCAPNREMSNDAFSSRSGSTDVRPTFEYIRSNSAEQTPRCVVDHDLDGLKRMVLWDSLLQVHERLHCCLRVASSFLGDDHLHCGVVVFYLTESFLHSLLEEIEAYVQGLGGVGQCAD